MSLNQRMAEGEYSQRGDKQTFLAGCVENQSFHPGNWEFREGCEYTNRDPPAMGHSWCLRLCKSLPQKRCRPQNNNRAPGLWHLSTVASHSSVLPYEPSSSQRQALEYRWWSNYHFQAPTNCRMNLLTTESLDNWIFFSRLRNMFASQHGITLFSKTVKESSHANWKDERYVALLTLLQSYHVLLSTPTWNGTVIWVVSKSTWATSYQLWYLVRTVVRCEQLFECHHVGSLSSNVMVGSGHLGDQVAQSIRVPFGEKISHYE